MTEMSKEGSLEIVFWISSYVQFVGPGKIFFEQFLIADNIDLSLGSGILLVEPIGIAVTTGVSGTGWRVLNICSVSLSAAARGEGSRVLTDLEI